MNEPNANYCTLIIRPTLDCNGNCQYCYVGNRNIKEVMNRNIIDLITLRINEFYADYPDSKIHAIWHGGEPTLMPLDFWKDVVNAFKRIDSDKFSMSIQTNLLNDDMNLYRWFIDHKIHISSSLDGPLQLNSLRGLNNSQYKLLLSNLSKIQSLQKYMGVICVTSKQQINSPVELLNFYESNHLNVKFNIVDSNDVSISVSYKNFYEFLSAIAERWLYNENSLIMVEPIASDFIGKVGYDQFSCNRIVDCYKHFLAINPNGDLYPCNRFADNPDWFYGNLRKFSFKAILKERAGFFFEKYKHVFDQCFSCNFKKLCGGGCNYLRINDSISDRVQFCTSIKAYFNKIRHILINKGGKKLCAEL